jgi:transposase
MPYSEAFVGIDVAKAELVIHLHPAGRCWRVPNSKPGLVKLRRQLARLARGGSLKVGFEASGGYERPLAQMLDRLGLQAYLLDPARVRSFARAERQLAKTDPLDAALIARCLAALHPVLTPHAPDRTSERVAEHVRARGALVAMATQLANQLEHVADRALRKLLDAQRAKLRAAILAIEKATARLIAACPDLARREQLLRSAPGIGPVIAACLIARLKELGRASSRQIGALAGLAPFDRQSGAGAKPARCSGGRADVRRALYLAALAIARSGKGPLAAAYQRLIAAGKPPKLALVATARKLLVTLNAMLKHDTPYQAS